MKEQLISFETAKLAKEKEFDIILDKYWCNYYMDEPFNKWKILPLDKLSVSWMEFPAPTQSLLQKWLREVHNIIIVIAPIHETENIKSLIKYWYYILDVEDNSDDEVFYGNYEEALEIGLQEGLKLISSISAKK